MIGLVVGAGVGIVAALLFLGVVLTFNVDVGRSVDEMSLETTSGVLYQPVLMDGEEGVMISKNRQTQWLSRQDMKEMLEALEETDSTDTKKEVER